MEMTNILEYRTVPGAGIYIALTKKCPLKCEHCCTNSTMTSNELESEDILNFIKSMVNNAPRFIFITGGEALLRPELVVDIIKVAHKNGSKVCLISGMFFALQERIDPILLEIFKSLDHFVASIDYFHEKKISRNKVFNALKIIKDYDCDISIQTLESEDDYVDELFNDAEKFFNKKVPFLVSTLQPMGRAQTIKINRQVHELKSKCFLPCKFATWPVVGFDGTIFACCQQEVIDMCRNAPSNLILGSIKQTKWEEVHEKINNLKHLRFLRTYGPTKIGVDNAITLEEYCKHCINIMDSNQILKEIDAIVDEETFSYMEMYIGNKLKRTGLLNMLKY